MKIQKPTNIQIVSDGEGTVVVLQDGKAVRTMFCEYHLHDDFLKWLKLELVKYPYDDEEDYG